MNIMPLTNITRDFFFFLFLVSSVSAFQGPCNVVIMAIQMERKGKYPPNFPALPFRQ